MKFKLEIELKSDLCASSGESMGSYIDSDVCYDESGIPYIPSKRIKGLLRECAEEYCECDNSLKNCIDTIFGEEGKRNPGKLKIDNAYIREYRQVIDDLKKLPKEFKQYASRQKILNNYTYTRYQTAVDESTGTSLENSLRSTRVIKQNNIFIADIDINATDEEIKLLNISAKLLQHMGINRTRGYGEVVCKIVEDKNMTEKENIEINFSDDTECEIKILIKAESEIMVSKQCAENSESYIPGSNILGYIAKRYIDDNNVDFENITEEYINLFLNGNVKYSNAYISEKNGIEFYPIPFSYTKVKNSKNEFYNKMFDVNKDNIQLSGIAGKFVTLSDEEYISKVKLTENYHHQRPTDKSIGHATPKYGGTLYQYTAIAKNQYFMAKITGKVNWLKKIIKYISVGEVFRVGKSKSTEYGKLRIENVEVLKVNNEEKTYKKFAVILTSNAIIMNNGQITIDKEKFVGKLKEK